MLPRFPFLRTLAGALLLGTMCLARAAGDVPVADEASIKGAVSAAIASEDFAALDREETQLRTTRAMQPNGIWGLRTFYAAVTIHWRVDDDAALTREEMFLKRWLAASPRSLAAPVLLGRAYTAHAFQRRGGSYASEVSAAQWAGYRQNLALAKEAFGINAAAQHGNPAWYSLRLVTATSDTMSPAEFAGLLRDSLVLAPDYNEPLRAAVHYASPKWGGSADMLEQLGQVVLKTAGPSAYTVMYTEAYRRNGCDCDFKAEDLHIQWPVFERGLQQRLQTLKGPYFVNMYAAIACNTGHTATLDGLKDLLIQRGKMRYAWNEFAAKPSCQQWMNELRAPEVQG